MPSFFKPSATFAISAVLFVAIFAANDPDGMMSEQSFVAAAEARVGRPLTPVSYAGVARRTTRRAVYTGAAVGAAAVAARPVVVVAPCTVVVDSNGTVIKPCP